MNYHRANFYLVLIIVFMLGVIAGVHRERNRRNGCTVAYRVKAELEKSRNIRVWKTPTP